MKYFGLTLVVLGLLLNVAPASAEEACKTSFDLVGRVDNLWHVGAATNPTLTACPGQEITLNATSETGIHNIAVDGVSSAPAASDAIDEGSSYAYVFTAPASGSGTYVCKFHSGTMHGVLNFAATTEAASNDDADEKKESPGVQVLGVTVAMIGAALLIGRRKQ
jgi:plastocyanin